MFYTVYQITNLLNNKIYVGVHQTKNLNDDYFGSGLNIKRAIQKYGIENFKKEYLHIFDNSINMFKAEKEIVDQIFIQKKETYNISVGGHGGWLYVDQNGKIINKGAWKDKKKEEELLNPFR